MKLAAASTVIATMFKSRSSSNASSEFIDITVPRTKAVLHIRRNHEANELTVGLRTGDHSRDVRFTIAPSLGFALGGSLTIEDGGEEPLTAALYLGYITIYFGACGYYGHYECPDPPPGGWPVDERTGSVIRPKPVMVKKPGLLRRAIHALVGNLNRRKTSAVLMRYDDGFVEGPHTTVRLTLWDDDHGWTRGKSRQYSVNLTELLWGKGVQSPEYVVEQRNVVVALPEGQYPMSALLLERQIRWPRWPLVRLYRGVSFRPACMLIPRRKSDGVEYEGNRAGGESRVSGTSIRAGIVELIGRVLRDREAYGRPNWTPKPTPLYKESHNLALSWVTRPEGAADSHAVCDRLLHGQTLWVLVNPKKPPMQFAPDYVVTGYAIGFRRNPVDGGVHVFRFANSPVVLVDGEPVQSSARVWPNSQVQLGPHELIAFYDPVGPAPSEVQLPLVETPQPDEDARADVAEVAATLDTSTPGPDEIEPTPAASGE